MTTIPACFCIAGSCMYNLPLVPDDFDVPKLLQTDRLCLRPLTIHDAVRDFDAVITSEERLRTVYDPGGEWPSGLTLEQNIIELGWHQTDSAAHFVCLHRRQPRTNRSAGLCIYLSVAEGSIRYRNNSLGSPVARCRGPRSTSI